MILIISRCRLVTMKEKTFNLEQFTNYMFYKKIYVYVKKTGIGLIILFFFDHTRNVFLLT